MRSFQQNYSTLQKQSAFVLKAKQLLFKFYKRQFKLHALEWDIEISELNFIVTIFSYLQILSLPFTQYSQINQQYLVLQIIFYLSRPSAYVADQMDNNLNIICLTLSLVFIMLLLFLVVKFKSYNSVRKIVNYYFTYYNHYIFLILLEIGYLQLLPYANSSNQSTTNQNNSYYNQNSFPNSSPIQATFGTLLILLAQITSFYQLQFSDCCVNIFERGLSRITFTKENSLSQMLKHLIILILYMDFYDKHGGMTFVIISCIIYFILVAKDFEINIPYSDKIKIYANVIGLNMLFIGIIIGQILQCYFKLVSQKSFIVISILILPITSLCYLQYYNSKFIKIVMYSTLNGNQNQIEKQIRNQKQKKIHHFCLQLAFLTRYKKTLFQSKLYKFLIISMYELHSTYCIEATCFCKSISKIIGIQEGHFETNAQIVTFILNNICQNILTKESYITQNHVSCQFFILIKYMILQKKNLYSLQKVIKILSQKQQLQISLNVKIVRGFWFKAGLNVFLDDIRESMDQHFQQELDTKKEIYNTLQACNLFFEVEKIKQQNQAAVLDAIQLKIETLNRIKNGVDSIQIFKNINDEYQKFLGECEQKLTHFYEKIPTRDNQSLLCFFLSEIKSDLRKSSEIMQKRQFSKTIDMNLLLGSNTIMQIFSNSVYSLQIGYSKNFGEILWFSQQVPKLLGYSRQEFQYHKNLNQILPNIIAFYHDELVNDYLKAGENNKMLQELKQGYLLHDFGWIIPIQMFISINFIDLSQIGFFVFFQQARQPSQFDGQIIVSENNTIENVNYELLEKIGLEQFPTSQTLQGFDMYEIMGEFDRIQNEICSLDQIDNLYFQNIRINLPNLHYFKTQAEIHEKQQQQSNPSLRSLKSKRSSIKSLSSMMFRSFMIDFKIIKKQKSLQYKDVKYFILLIDKIIDLKKQNGSQSAIQTERDIDDIMSPDIPNIKIQKELNYMNAPQTSERDFFKKLNSKDYQNNDVFNINKNQIKSIFSQKSKKKSFAKRLTIKQPSIELEKMKTLQKNEDNEKKIQIPSKEVSESNTALQFKDEYENFENAGSMIEIESSIFKQLKELDQNKFGKANHGQKFQQSILEDLDSSFFNQKKYQISEDIESFRPSEGYPSKYDHQNKIYSQNLIDVSQISVIHKPESERNILQKSQIASDQSIQVSQQLIESYNLGKFSPQKRNFELKKLKTTNEKLFKSHSAMKGSEQVPILQQDEQLASFRMEQSWSLNQEEENDQQKNEMVENVELELIIENESDQNIENNQNQGSISIIDRYKQESTSVIIKEESESQFHTKTQFSHKSLRSQKSFKSQKTFRSRKTESNKQKYSSTNKIQNIDLTQTKRKANKTSTFVSTYQQKQHTIDTISNNQNKETKANNNDTLFNQENQAILPEIKLEQPDPNERVKNDQQSVTSSLQKSIFQSKYDNFTKFLSKNNPPDLKKLKILKIFEFLIVLSITLWANLLFFFNFTDFQDQIYLMKFRSSTLQPISISLSMVYQLLQNQNLLQDGKISQTEYNSAAELVYNYVSDSYLTFNTGLDQNLNQKYARDTYTSNNITINNFSNDYKTEMPLILSTLLFKQMLFSFNLTAESLQKGQAVSFNSASLKFSLDNYSSLYEFFSQLSIDLKQQITDDMNKIQLFFIIQLICIFLSYIIMQIFEFYYYRQFTHFIKLILRMYESTTLTQIQSELQRLTRIQQMTDGDSSSLIFCYDFDLRAKEIALRADSKKIQQKQEELQNSVSRQTNKRVQKTKNGKEKVNKRAQRNFRIESNYLSYKSFFIILIINSVPFFAYIAISLGLIKTYTNNLSYALTSYSRFADAQTYIQTSYILRQQIQNYVPSSEQNVQSSNNIIRQFINSVDEANYFSSSSIDQYISDLQRIDESLENEINEIISTNACIQDSIFSDNIPATLLKNLIGRCETSINGQLKLGVQAYISNFIQSMSVVINLNFENSKQLDLYSDQAIISVIPAKIIEECSNKIHEKLISVTQFNTIIIFSFGFVFLFTMLITLCYYIIYQNKIMKSEYKQAQNIIFLLPTITLLNDETFFKQISYLNMKL